jgi:hypothetical protein
MLRHFNNRVHGKFVRSYFLLEREQGINLVFLLHLGTQYGLTVKLAVANLAEREVKLYGNYRSQSFSSRK